MSSKQEQFIRFGKESKEIKAQENSVYKEEATEVVTPLGEKVSYGLLGELQVDYTFFTLGHVYSAANVPYSFLEQYTAEEDAEVHFLTIEAPKAFMEGLEAPEGSWGNILHAIQKDKFQKFSDWMQGQFLSRKLEGQFTGIYHMDQTIPDPVYKNDPGYLHPEDSIKVRFFLPQTQRGRVVILVEPSGQVAFMVERTPTGVARELLTLKTINEQGVK